MMKQSKNDKEFITEMLKIFGTHDGALFSFAMNLLFLIRTCKRMARPIISAVLQYQIDSGLSGSTSIISDHRGDRLIKSTSSQRHHSTRSNRNPKVVRRRTLAILGTRHTKPSLSGTI
jgi:hypothetical protein